MRNQLKRIFPRKFIRNVEDYGGLIALKKSLKYTAQPLYNEIRFIIYEIDLSQGEGKKCVNNNLEFRIIGANDFHSINQIEQSEEWLKGSLKPKLQTNGICMAIMDGSKLAGFNLATKGEGFIKLLKLQIITEPDEAWSEHIMVHHDYRGRKLANDLRNCFYTELQKKGIKALYGHRQEFNVASKGSAKKYTAKELGKATYRNICGFEQLYFKKSDSERNFSISKTNDTEDKKYPFSVHISQLKD